MEGIYVYQQIVKTPEEWEGNTTVWPENVWLFEKLGDDIGLGQWSIRWNV